MLTDAGFWNNIASNLIGSLVGAALGVGGALWVARWQERREASGRQKLQKEEENARKAKEKEQRLRVIGVLEKELATNEDVAREHYEAAGNRLELAWFRRQLSMERRELVRPVIMEGYLEDVPVFDPIVEAYLRIKDLVIFEADYIASYGRPGESKVRNDPNLKNQMTSGNDKLWQLCDSAVRAIQEARKVLGAQLKATES